MIGCWLALLGIVAMIGIIAEDCEGLTIPTVDHFPSINTGWPVAKTSVMAPFCSANKRCDRAGAGHVSCACLEGRLHYRTCVLYLSYT